MQRSAKAAELGAELADLAQGLGLREQFAALFRHKTLCESVQGDDPRTRRGDTRTDPDRSQKGPKAEPARNRSWSEMLDRLVQERAIEVLRENPRAFSNPICNRKPWSPRSWRARAYGGAGSTPRHSTEWGCRDCRRKDVAHESAGHCDTCYMRCSNGTGSFKSNGSRSTRSSSWE